MLQSAFSQLPTRSERENGNSADVERSRLAGRYLEVPTFGVDAPPCFPRPLMGLTSSQSLLRLYPFSKSFQAFRGTPSENSHRSRIRIGDIRNRSFKSQESLHRI